MVVHVCNPSARAVEREEVGRELGGEGEGEREGGRGGSKF